MAKIHDRMPVILPQDRESRWLDHGTDAEELNSFLVPFPPEQMSVHAISPRVNNAQNEGPELIVPAGGPVRFAPVTQEQNNG
jgi:putative SOS response-associated peptidase YedK